MEKQKIDWSEYFYYDETSPSCLRWRVDKYSAAGRRRNVVAGDVAGSMRKDKYWYVRLNRKAYQVHRIVYEILVGEITEDEVIDHIDGCSANNIVSNLRSVPRKLNSRNNKLYINNVTGVVGVHRVSDGTEKYEYYRATYYDLFGNFHQKNFSILKLGEEEAFRLACEYRAKIIEELNAQGAGYTERHGV